MNNRRLGRLEQAMELLNSRARTWNIVTISRIKGNLSTEILCQSLEMIQYRHPRLNSQIIRENNCLSFQSSGLKKIPLRFVQQAGTETWEDVVYEEMNQGIDSSQGLIRVVLVSGHGQINYLITTTHHAIADGLSSINLHSEIFTYCQKVVAGEQVNPVPSLLALPPTEDLLPEWTKGFGGKLSSILFLGKVIFQKVWNQPASLGFEKYTPISKRSCDIVHKQIDQHLTQQFVNRCRQENTTVNSALSAILMFTVARKVIKANQKTIHLNCLSHLDLRRRLEPNISEENMAILASSIMGFYKVENNFSFWDLAREVKEKLERMTKSGDIFKMSLIARYLIDLCFLYPRKISATVSVSNLGRINIPKNYGEFELEDISFAASNTLYAGVLALHSSTFSGKMVLNFVFSQPSISREMMESLVENVVSCMIDVCSSDPLLVVQKDKEKQIILSGRQKN
jgi:hypothetical protein